MYLKTGYYTRFLRRAHFDFPNPEVQMDLVFGRKAKEKSFNPGMCILYPGFHSLIRPGLQFVPILFSF